MCDWPSVLRFYARFSYLPSSSSSDSSWTHLDANMLHHPHSTLFPLFCLIQTCSILQKCPHIGPLNWSSYFNDITICDNNNIISGPRFIPVFDRIFFVLWNDDNKKKNEMKSLQPMFWHHFRDPVLCFWTKRRCICPRTKKKETPAVASTPSSAIASISQFP